MWHKFSSLVQLCCSTSATLACRRPPPNAPTYKHPVPTPVICGYILRRTLRSDPPELYLIVRRSGRSRCPSSLRGSYLRRPVWRAPWYSRSSPRSQPSLALPEQPRICTWKLRIFESVPRAATAIVPPQSRIHLLPQAPHQWVSSECLGCRNMLLWVKFSLNCWNEWHFSLFWLK